MGDKITLDYDKTTYEQRYFSTINFTQTYTLQDILEHLSPFHRKTVLSYEPDEWLKVGYISLVSQLMNK